MANEDYNIKAVVKALGLKQTSSGKDELRFGTKGSLCVDTAKNTFFDHEQNIGGGCLDFILHHGVANDQRSAAQWAKDQGILQSPAITTKTPTREHIYRDENGQPIRRAIKYDNGKWTQQHFENNSWQSGVKGVPNIPYGLNRLAKDSSDNLVFIFEGEKDCERAWAHGLLATTNVGGAGNWRDDLNTHLTGRTVCIVPDNDNAGRDHATKVAASLKTSGISCFTLSKYADNLPDKADFSDWMDANGDDVKAFIKLADVAKSSPMESNSGTPSDLSGFNFISAEELVTKHFDPVKFLVPDILPEIGLAMISGAPKVGKSYFCLHLVSKIPSDRKIIYLSAEDNERRLQTRIAQVFPSSTPKNLLLFAGLSSENPLPRGAAALGFIRNVKAKYPSTACVFIDTVAGIRERTGAEKNYETTEAEFGALRKLAHELGIAVVAVHHNRKKTDTGGSPLEAILGSQGISATVETILILQQVVGSQSIDLFVTGKDIVEQELRYEWQSPGFAAAGETIEAALGSFQKACLDHIRNHPRCTQQAISEETKRSKSTVSEAIAKLIQRGLVTKAENGRLIIPLTNPTNLTNLPNLTN